VAQKQMLQHALMLTVRLLGICFLGIGSKINEMFKCYSSNKQDHFISQSVLLITVISSAVSIT
jgi:hypothetical protein